MKHTSFAFLACLIFAVSVRAQPHAAGHGGESMPGMAAPTSSPGRVALPASGTPPHLLFDWAPPVDDRMRFNYVLIDLFEVSTGDAPDSLTWDTQGWYGGDHSKFWWKAEGATQTQGPSSGEAELQALYSRLVAPFWDFQIGLRYDRTWGPGPNRERAFAVIGFDGLAPYWFEIEPAIFVSEGGDISASLTATYDALLTQQLILQPRLDVNAAIQSVPKFGVGSGVNDIELGLRLRYEIRREFAPYIGVTWRRVLGNSADLATAGGEETSIVSIVIGVRAWF